MTALPKILCNGYSFTPKNGASDITYNISLVMEVNNCSVITFKNNVPQGEPQKVDSSYSYLIRKGDLKVLTSIEGYRMVFLLGAAISFIATGCLFAVKRNYNFSVIGVTATGILSLCSWYQNQKGRKASFKVANQILMAMRGGTHCYIPSEYGL